MVLWLPLLGNGAWLREEPMKLVSSKEESSEGAAFVSLDWRNLDPEVRSGSGEIGGGAFSFISYCLSVCPFSILCFP